MTLKRDGEVIAVTITPGRTARVTIRTGDGPRRSNHRSPARNLSRHREEVSRALREARKPKTEDLDTTNRFGVGTCAGLVGVRLVGGRFSFTEAEAENLAAYLLILSGVSREHFNALVEAIENT